MLLYLNINSNLQMPIIISLSFLVTNRFYRPPLASCIEGHREGMQYYVSKLEDYPNSRAFLNVLHIVRAVRE
jgi:hypothetical protein